MKSSENQQRVFLNIKSSVWIVTQSVCNAGHVLCKQCPQQQPGKMIWTSEPYSYRVQSLVFSLNNWHCLILWMNCNLKHLQWTSCTLQTMPLATTWQDDMNHWTIPLQSPESASQPKQLTDKLHYLFQMNIATLKKLSNISEGEFVPAFDHQLCIACTSC